MCRLERKLGLINATHTEMSFGFLFILCDTVVYELSTRAEGGVHDWRTLRAQVCVSARKSTQYLTSIYVMTVLVSDYLPIDSRSSGPLSALTPVRKGRNCSTATRRGTGERFLDSRIIVHQFSLWTKSQELFIFFFLGNITPTTQGTKRAISDVVLSLACL